MKNIIISSLLTLFVLIDASFAQGKNLSLEESKELAFRNNYSAKNSRLEIEASRQVKKSVFTNFFPGISAGGAAFRANENMMEIKTEGGNLPVYDGNPINLFTPTQFAYLPGSTMGLLKKGTFGAVNAVQPVFMGGRIYNGYKLAGVGEEVSELK
ncbi:MAG: TolC family protein, partial [Bacteroidota bacterium]|nr:TolC family protein [Bacteroidota bacterium]